MTIKIEGKEVKIMVGTQMKTIGELNNRVLRIKRDRDKHLMRKFNAYGFAKQLIEETFFDHVHIVETQPQGIVNYLIDRNDILTSGLYYKAEEFEKQIFVDLDTLQKYKINAH